VRNIESFQSQHPLTPPCRVVDSGTAHAADPNDDDVKPLRHDTLPLPPQYPLPYWPPPTNLARSVCTGAIWARSRPYFGAGCLSGEQSAPSKLSASGWAMFGAVASVASYAPTCQDPAATMTRVGAFVTTASGSMSTAPVLALLTIARYRRSHLL